MHNKKLNTIVLKELQNAGRGGGLSGIEIIDGAVMADEEWTSANVSFFFDRSTFLSIAGPVEGAFETPMLICGD